jgi:DNA repair exonuclease SbcCD ATPase subunit
LVKDIGKLKEKLRRLQAEKQELAEKAEQAERQAGTASEAKQLAAEAITATEQAAAELSRLREQLTAAQASIQAAFDATVARLPEREQALWKEMPGSVAEKFALLAKHHGIITGSSGGDDQQAKPKPGTPAPPANTGTASGPVRMDRELQQLMARARAGDRQALERAKQLAWQKVKLPAPGFPT